jgi:hypothetical protein
VAEQAVKVRGYTEVVRGLAVIDKGLKRALFVGLRSAAGPITEDTRRRLEGYRGMSTNTIRPSATLKAVQVVQRKGKVGKRPDFGALQMREGFIPALESNEGLTVERVTAAVDALIVFGGF